MHLYIFTQCLTQASLKIVCHCKHQPILQGSEVECFPGMFYMIIKTMQVKVRHSFHVLAIGELIQGNIVMATIIFILVLLLTFFTM